MVPIFEVFGKEMSVYMLLALAGALTVLFFGYKTAEKRGLDEFKMLFMTLWAFVGVLIGGHIMYGITNFRAMIKFFKLAFTFSFSSFDSFLTAFQWIFGGAVFYGGLIGAMIASAIYAKFAKINSDYFDIGACMIPLFHTFGRLGCFFSGCCYGIKSHFGFVYHYALDPEANGVTRFPVQLVEAAFNLGLFILLWYLLRHGKQKGRLLAWYLFLYSIIRFSLEFLRGDAIRGRLWIFSTSQWISILLFIPAAVILLTKRKNAEY